MSASDTKRHHVKKIIFESYSDVGYNYKLTDLQAAIAREQLKRIPRILKKRRSLADHYHNQLKKTLQIEIPCEPVWARSNWQSYCVRLPKGCRQKAVMQFLLDRDVATRRGIMCAHLEAPYKNSPAYHLKESERAQNECILLPLYPDLTKQEQNKIIRLLKEAITHEKQRTK